LSTTLTPDGAEFLRIIPVGQIAAVASFYDISVGQALAMFGDIPGELGIATGISEVPEPMQAYVPTRDDLTVLSNRSDGKYPWLVEKPTPLQIATSAFRLRRSVAWVIQRMAQLSSIASFLPVISPKAGASLLDVHPDVRDLVLLSSDLQLNGRPVFDVTALHVLRAAVRMGLSCYDVAERLANFRAIGLRIRVGVSHAPRGIASWEDLAAMTVGCDAATALPQGDVPEAHILEVCGLTGANKSDVVSRIKRHARLFRVQLQSVKLPDGSSGAP
jgi:hypothetical protein